MNLQRVFGERLLALLEEKNISQQEFAEKIGCSRQSINFYILGKRSPDIVLAGKMATFLGVSCDYLVGLSDYRDMKDAQITVKQAGIDYEKEVLPYNRLQAQRTLDLLNALLEHDAFGLLLQYIKRYRDLLHGEDEMAILQNFMVELESPLSGKKYGTKEENEAMMREFGLYIINRHFDDIIRDICK